MSGELRRPLDGGCLCGKVRYRISAIGDAFWCHCTMCRRASGAAALPWVSVPRAAFAIMQGELCRHESSPGVSRGFCGACGSPIMFDMKAEAEVDITLGTLDEPDTLAPNHHLWVSSALVMSKELGEELPRYQCERIAHKD